MRLSLALPFSALVLSLASCSDPDTFVPIPEFSGPAGVIEGTLTYSGLPPCTENGRILGAAVVLAFDTRLLPAPSGLGTSASSLDAIPGEVLFDSIRDKLVFDKSGARRCPDKDAPFVSVSATWTIAPLSAATYQVRGFYDRNDDFNPAWSISNLPTAGDVGGGAIDNIEDVLMGKAYPAYTEIDIGVRDASGALAIPESGYHVGGIGVTLGFALELERPIFYPSEVKDATAAGNTDPRKVVIPSDLQLGPLFVPPGLPNDDAFVRIVLTAGVEASEVNAAAVTPFFFPVKGAIPPLFYTTPEDVTGEGLLDGSDHITETALLPSLYPLSVFSKLVPENRLVSQLRPRVIMQGITLDNSLAETAQRLPTDPTMPPQPQFKPTITVAIRPAAICVDPLDTTKKGTLVVSHADDTTGAPILTDEASVKAGLQKQFGRPFDIVVGCLPEGQYSMNLVYPTGQAWTLPNEAGVCAAAEPQTADGKNCRAVTNSRPRLSSQDVLVTVGAPKDTQYCKDHPTPTACSALPN